MGTTTSEVDSSIRSSYKAQIVSDPLKYQETIQIPKYSLKRTASPKKCVFVYIQPKDKLDTIIVANNSEEDIEMNQPRDHQKEKNLREEEEKQTKQNYHNSNEKQEKQTEQKEKKKIQKKNLKQKEINKKDVKKGIKQQRQARKSQREEDDKQEKGQLGKILVQWNTFIKVKKKNYLEDYTHIKEIGKGAFGTVSKIQKKHGGMLRAAKIIKGAVFNKKLKDRREKFINQIIIPMKLDHPNLNKLFEVFEWKNQFVLIMQLCQGGDLFNRIKKGGIFTEKKVAEMLKQILSVVVYLHRNNIVHRDLKPENILYDTESNSLKIIDFGTAVQLKDNTKKLTTLVGTPSYLAPEVVKGNYDHQCDIWSCGVIMYLLLCGSPPFLGHNEKDIMRKIVHDQVSFRDHIWKRRSRDSQQLILKMLKKNPEQRITAMEVLNSEWMNNTGSQEITDVGNQVIKNLHSFHFKNKLKAVVYTYIASQLYSNKDKEKLLKAFREMDKDGDGVLGKEELLQVFKNYNGYSFTEQEIEKIITLVDTNGSGLIDFTEFLVAASNQQELLQRQRLENAFSYLDTDHSGYITPDEVKQFLDDTEETTQEIKKIFDDVDKNGDGKISKKQFLTLLMKKN